MRIIICDPQLAFAESLAHTLTIRGHQVIGLVTRSRDAARMVGDMHADLCVTRVSASEVDAEERANLPVIADRCNMVVLVDALNPCLQHALMSAGAQGIAEMRQGIDQLLNVIDRVQAGRTAFPESTLHSLPNPIRPATDMHRLAEYLSPREREVLSALVRGDDTETIARSMGISRTTARSHVQSMLTKLGTHTRVSTVTLAVRAGLVSAQTGAWTALR